MAIRHGAWDMGLLPLALFIAVGVAALSPASAQSAVSPSIEGPVTGGSRGYPYSASVIDLAPYGYVEEEYFISGNAHALAPRQPKPLTRDGRWDFTLSGPARPYKTRLLVRRPPANRFNGTVIVEFMQEYYGTERDTNYRWNAEAILREGFGWVGVSLHHEGIDGPPPAATNKVASRTISTVGNKPLTQWDPARYGTLTVPDSGLSYDILSQAGRAVGPRRDKSAVDPMGGLPVRNVIAVGNSIAGARIAHYVNAVQPFAKVFDGFYIQDLEIGRISPSAGVKLPERSWVRTDTAVPVIVLNTTSYVPDTTAQPEGPKLRFWTPAGSSHTTTFQMGRADAGNRRDFGTALDLCAPDEANNLPVQYYSSAAIVALKKWIDGGTAPRGFPLVKVTGAKGMEPTIVKDRFGNPEGGLRTPWVNVPIARYSWGDECIGRSGHTYPFSADQLKALYGTPAVYLKRFTADVRRGEQEGTLLPVDAEAAIVTAAKVRW